MSDKVPGEKVGRFFAILFKYQKDKIQESPEDKRPVRAVPEAGEQPDDQKIKDMSCFGHSVAAERNIDIISEPAAEGNMLFSPEFLDRFRGIRIIEVYENKKT